MTQHFIRKQAGFGVIQRSGPYPSVQVDDRGTGIVSQTGFTLMVNAITDIGLEIALQRALRPWEKSSGPGIIRIKSCGSSGIVGCWWQLFD